MGRAGQTLLVAVLLTILAVPLIASCDSQPPAGGVHVLTAEGVIGPVLANYLQRGIDEAEQGDAEAVVIRLETPGGLDTSMREIIQRINAASVPVAVYVAPSGARAASAGAFITMAGHVAAMAPNTAIGAAHPVAAGGEELEGDAREKAENDAAAYIRSIAQARERNADWAERAVRESIAASASEAVDLDVVDYEASSLAELLRQMDGREVALARGGVATLQTADVVPSENDMRLTERLLLVISDPNIAFLLLSLGSLALVLELFNPSGIGAAVGVLALIVAFFSLGTLPVNWAGVALVVLGTGLLAAELSFFSGGFLGITGVVVMVMGALFLTTSSQPQFEVSRWLAIGLPTIAGAGIGVLALFLLRSRRRAAQVGTSTLLGLTGIVRTALTDRSGYVSVQGERWRARLDATSERTLQPGDAVVVTGVEGLELVVRRAEAEAHQPAQPVEHRNEQPRPDEKAGNEQGPAGNRGG